MGARLSATWVRAWAQHGCAPKRNRNAFPINRGPLFGRPKGRRPRDQASISTASPSAAWAAASLAMGTRKGEHDT